MRGRTNTTSSGAAIAAPEEGEEAHDDGLSGYELIASAIAGRAVLVRCAPPGEPSFTDGRTIFLSDVLSGSHQIEALVVQSALIGAGSLERGVIRKLAAHPARTRRYLAIEGWRALDASALLPPTALTGHPDHARTQSSSAAESLRLALGRSRTADPPPVFGVLRPRRLLAADPIEDASTPSLQDLIDADSLEQEILPEVGEDDETEESLFLKLLSNPVARGGGMLGKLLKMLGASTSRGSGPPGAEVPLSGSQTTRRGSRKGTPATLPGAMSPMSMIRADHEDWLYPEWDEFEQRYRPEWCTVREYQANVGGEAPTAGQGDEYLRRRLARLALALERHRHERQGDELDIDALVQLRVDLLSGVTPEERIYVDTLRTRRDLAVAVLIDISGSSSEGSAASASVHDLQLQAAGALLGAHHSLGDRVAAYGFHSTGRSGVFIERVKSFDEPLDGSALSRLAGLTSGGFTRLGAGIRHATRALEDEAGTHRQLLIVLSDGFPYDDGYEGTYAEADARRALNEARSSGVGCLCITLGSSTDLGGLDRVFGASAHARADEFDDLIPDLNRLFHRALASAETRRRLGGKAMHDDTKTRMGAIR